MCENSGSAAHVDQPQALQQLLGNRDPTDARFVALYAELRRIAERQARTERPTATFQPTALLHDAYLRLAEAGHATFETDLQLMSYMGTVMRHVLVDAERKRRSAKRGKKPQYVTLTSIADSFPQMEVDLLD